MSQPEADASASASVAVDPPRGWVFRLLYGVGRRLSAWPRPLTALLALGWGTLIWISSSQPAGQSTPGFFISAVANLAHAPLFGLLALFVAPNILRGERRPNRAVAWPRITLLQLIFVLGVVVLYGIVDELHQGRTPGRDPSAMDVGTDLVGAGCVLWIIHYLGRAEASEMGLRLRLLFGVGACIAIAVLGTLF